MSVLKTYGDTSGYHPSKTFRIRGGQIEGMIDGLDAVRQSAELILSTERFEWEIFSVDYGAELRGLIGERRDAYIDADFERRITEALLEDDRITEVKDFSLTFDKENARVRLTLMTDYGELPLERSVPIGRKV